MQQCHKIVTSLQEGLLTIAHSYFIYIYILQKRRERSHSSAKYLSHARLVTNIRKFCKNNLLFDHTGDSSTVQWFLPTIYAKYAAKKKLFLPLPPSNNFQYRSERRLTPPKEMERDQSQSSQSLDCSESIKKSLFLYSTLSFSRCLQVHLIHCFQRCME